MNLGIGLGVTNYLRVPTVAISPDDLIAALFSSGEEGAWYDPSDLSTVWQDAAGTTPATVGDPVGRIDDKSGNGNHATQSTSTARPVLQSSGGLYYLDFDGVDDFLQTAPTGFASTSDAMIAFAGNGNNINLTNSIGISSGSYQAQTDWATLRLNYLGNTEFNTNKANTALYAATQPYQVSTPTVHVGYVNGLTVALRLDANETTTARPTAYTLNLDQEIDIGALDLNGTTIQWSNIDFYGGIVRMVAPTPDEITNVESYLADKSGVTLP